MSTALKVFEVKKTELELTEDEVLLSIKKGYEEFFFIGNRLRLIKSEKRHRQLLDGDGKTVLYPTWESYCKSGRLPYKPAYADQVIAASKVRDELGKTPAIAGVWSEGSIRPLTTVKGKEKTREGRQGCDARGYREPEGFQPQEAQVAYGYPREEAY